MMCPPLSLVLQAPFCLHCLRSTPGSALLTPPAEPSCTLKATPTPTLSHLGVSLPSLHLHLEVQLLNTNCRLPSPVGSWLQCPAPRLRVDVFPGHLHPCGRTCKTLLAPGLGFSSVLAIVAIWGVNPQMEDLSVFPAL